MLTVKVSLLGSGNSSTCRPLPRTYSVIPSTLVTWRGAAAGFAGVAGGAGGLAAGAGAGLAGGGAASAAEPSDPTAMPRARASAAEVFTSGLYRRARESGSCRLLTAPTVGPATLRHGSVAGGLTPRLFDGILQLRGVVRRRVAWRRRLRDIVPTWRASCAGSRRGSAHCRCPR